MNHLNEVDVVDTKSFVMYAHQRTGIPYPSFKEIAATKKYLDILFERYPGMTWGSLCKIVTWAVSKKKRFYNSIQLVEAGHRMAWLDGQLPELNATPQDVEEQKRVDRLLAEPHLPEDWRRRFTLAQSVQERTAVLELWDAEGA